MSAATGGDHDKNMFTLAQYPDLPEKYTLQQDLGEGAFSSVYKGLNNETGETVAIKIINKLNLTPKQLTNIHNEIQIMNTLANAGNQPNILRLIESYDRTDNCFLILEYCDGGEIFNKIIEYTYFSEQLAKHVFLQLLDAIRFLHQNNVVHRDIKPENLLFKRIPFAPRTEAEFKLSLRSSDDELKQDEGKFIPGIGGGSIGMIKLADFGLAKLLRFDPLASKGNALSNLKTPCGTAGYTAPEVIHCGVENKRRFRNSMSKSNYYSKAVDIWSLGCFLYTILCGFPPFYDDNHDILTQKIITANYVFLEPWWDEVSADAKDLISNMLVINPEKRITIEEIYQHPWMADATPLQSLSYFPNVARQSSSLQVPDLDPPKRVLSASPGPNMAGGLVSPGIAIKQVFNNPAMSHVNLKLLARLQRGDDVDPRELKFDNGTKFHVKNKSHLPRTPNPVRDLNFKDVFENDSRTGVADFADSDSEIGDVLEDSDGFDDDEGYNLELELKFISTSEAALETEFQDKLAGLKYLSISSTSSTDSLKLLHNEEEYATRSSSVISGINGDYKFTLNLNDLNLLRRRSSTKSGNNHV